MSRHILDRTKGLMRAGQGRSVDGPVGARRERRESGGLASNVGFRSDCLHLGYLVIARGYYACNRQTFGESTVDGRCLDWGFRSTGRLDGKLR